MGKIRFIGAADIPFRRGSSAGNPDVPLEERVNTETRYFTTGSESEGQLMEARFLPGLVISSHAHHAPEVVYIVEGELHFGNRVCGPGSVIEVPADTLYGFRAGSDGVRFLNFRPRNDNSYVSKEAFMTARRGTPPVGKASAE